MKCYYQDLAAADASNCYQRFRFIGLKGGENGFANEARIIGGTVDGDRSAIKFTSVGEREYAWSTRRHARSPTLPLGSLFI